MWPGIAGDVTLLPFKKGDLLILTKKQGLLASESWTMGQNDRTGSTGLVPTSCLYTIPTVTKPSVQLLVSCTQARHSWAHGEGALPGILAQGPAPHLIEGHEGHLGFRSAMPAPPSLWVNGEADSVCAVLYTHITVRLSKWAFLPSLPPWVCPGNKLILSPASASCKP